MALIVEVKVVPNSGKNEWAIEKSGSLKCFLKSLPEKGAANRELIKNLSKLLKLTQSDIEIVSGLTSRKKRIKIHTDLTLEKFYSLLNISYQEEIFN